MIIILGACHPLGQTAAVAFAEKGARVVAIDEDAAGLNSVCAQNPDWIEALAIENIETQMVPTLKDAWGKQRIDLVVNLMPLVRDDDISGQMRTLGAVLRTTLRGLVAGQGRMINVTRRPADPLALVAQGMQASLSAASASLNTALAGKGVGVHCVSLPASGEARVLETLVFLASPAGRGVRGTTFDLDKIQP